MILNLVDRRVGVRSADPEAGWFVENFPLLVELAVGIGAADWAVDLVLVDDGLMAKLNEGYRQSTGVTDVLSFSYLVPAAADDALLAAGVACAATALKLDETVHPYDGASDSGLVVGEVVMAPGFVVRRCLANSWPVELEFPMLVVHGLLHVLGWDHMEQDERQAMQDLEEKILATVNLTHPLRQRS